MFIRNYYGKTVRTADNNMAPGEPVVCGSCHDADSDSHDLNIATTEGGPLGNGSNFVWGKVFTELTKPSPNFTCDTCHENRYAVHVTGTAHNNRIIDSFCANCHTSDTREPGSPGYGSLASAADVDALHGVVSANFVPFATTTPARSLIKQL